MLTEDIRPTSEYRGPNKGDWREVKATYEGQTAPRSGDGSTSRSFTVFKLPANLQPFNPEPDGESASWISPSGCKLTSIVELDKEWLPDVWSVNPHSGREKQCRGPQFIVDETGLITQKVCICDGIYCNHKWPPYTAYHDLEPPPKKFESKDTSPASATDDRAELFYRADMRWNDLRAHRLQHELVRQDIEKRGFFVDTKRSYTLWPSPMQDDFEVRELVSKMIQKRYAIDKAKDSWLSYLGRAGALW